MTTTNEIQQELTQMSESLAQIEQDLQGKEQFDEILDDKLVMLYKKYEELNAKITKDNMTKELIKNLVKFANDYNQSAEKIANLPKKGYFYTLINLLWGNNNNQPNINSGKLSQQPENTAQQNNEAIAKQLYTQQKETSTPDDSFAIQNKDNETNTNSQQPENTAQQNNEAIAEQLKTQMRAYQYCIMALNEQITLDQCLAVYNQYKDELKNKMELDSFNNPNLLASWKKKQEEAQTAMDTTIQSVLKKYENDLEQKRSVIEANVTSIVENHEFYTKNARAALFDINSPELNSFNLNTYETNKTDCASMIHLLLASIDTSLQLPCTEENKNYLQGTQQYLQNVLAQLETIQHQDNSITEKVNRRSKLNEGGDSSFSALMASIVENSPVNNQKLESIATARSLEQLNLLDKSTNYVNGINVATNETLKQEALALLQKIKDENTCIETLETSPSNTQPSFFQALEKLITKDAELVQRAGGDPTSMEWLAHLQLDNLIFGLTAAARHYVEATGAEPTVESTIDGSTVESTSSELTIETPLATFRRTCRNLIANLDKTIINQPRGWSITRVVNNITAAIDALIDTVLRNVLNTTNTVNMHNFFHRATDTKTAVESMEAAINQVQQAPRAGG